MADRNIYPEIAPEKFRFAQLGDQITDKKLDTKPIGYFRDAWMRFRRNKASVVAAVIIGILLIFAIIGPMVSPYDVSYNDKYMIQKLPKCEAFAWAGWDGCSTMTLSASDYWYYRAIGVETGMDPIVEVYDEFDIETAIGTMVTKKHYYKVSMDSYTRDGVIFATLTKNQYEALQAYQDEHGVQIIYPATPVASNSGASTINQYNANNWYQTQASGKNKGLPVGYDPETGLVAWENAYEPYTGTDGYHSRMRVEGEGEYLYNYAVAKQGGQYYVRVHYYRYYEYLNGFEPSFLFGSNQYGQDIFTRLSNGARFSFLLSISVSMINMFLGAIYGSIAGYYGGTADIIMQRISEILSGVPFMVVVTLFQLHLAEKVGVVTCLLFAFVATGWIGTAGLVRTLFYRFKNQEHVLAARTLGASDARLMFRHIFPNSLGTIITSSVLVIPGVIFSESTLSYLNIVNLESSSITSVGTLLANGRGQMSSYPHIIFFPALFISLLEISFNLFGNGLRDAFNPSLRGSDA